MTTSVGQALLALIESDLATVGGQPLITLITGLKTDAGNQLKQAADIMAFTAAAPAAGLQLEVMVEQQLLQMAITKIQAYVASKTTPVVGGVGATVS